MNSTLSTEWQGYVKKIRISYRIGMSTDTWVGIAFVVSTYETNVYFKVKNSPQSLLHDNLQ